MTLNITKNIEEIINDAVQSGRYASADEMLARLVEEDARRTGGRNSEPQEGSDASVHRLEMWVDGHVSHSITVDDSRESVFAVRGE